MRHCNRLTLILFACFCTYFFQPARTGLSLDNATLGGGICLDRYAQAVPPTHGAQKAGTEPPVETPVYKPPMRGAPGGRLGGGTRGMGDEEAKVFLLAPNHLGLTGQEQPELFWFTPDVLKSPLKLLISEQKTNRLLVDTTLTPPSHPGIQRISLREFSVRLRAGIPYECFLRLMSGPGKGAGEIIAACEIERVKLDMKLQGRLKKTGKLKTPHVFAESHLWYDALSAVSDLIDETPNDRGLRAQRASLLKQIGLGPAADYEMGEAERRKGPQP